MNLTLIVVCVFCFTIPTIRCDTSKPNSTTEFLNQLLLNYDKLERPNYQGEPLDVAVSAYVLDLFEINEKEQTFSIDLYLRHEWKDPRLEFTEAEAGKMRIILDKDFAGRIWIVNPFIVNERSSQMHNLLSESSFTRLSSDGTVLVSTRYTIKVACRMSLKWFPFDRHICPMEIESYGHTAEDYAFSWKVGADGKTDRAVMLAKDLTTLQFTVAGINYKDEREETKTAKFAKLSVEFFFVRCALRHVQDIYLPSLVITLLSFASLIHSAGPVHNRLYLSIFLTGLHMLLMSQKASSMPPVSYQTAVDFYLVICLLTILIAVFCMFGIFTEQVIYVTSYNDVFIIHAQVNVVSCMVISCLQGNGALQENGKQALIDSTAALSPGASRIWRILVKLRFLLPITFVIFNVVYWLVIAFGSSSFPEDFIDLNN